MSNTLKICIKVYHTPCPSKLALAWHWPRQSLSNALAIRPKRMQQHVIKFPVSNLSVQPCSYNMPLLFHTCNQP